MRSLFRNYLDADVIDLIHAYPLALMVSGGPGDWATTPLPLLPDVDSEGRLTRLVGHMSRANPQAAFLEQDPRACFLFQGPHGYLSPTLVPDRTWAPTWNYILLRVHAEVTFRPENNDSALRRLVAAMEAGRENAWSVEEMGERYHKLSQYIVAFDATVQSVDATFKLSQDEKPVMFQNILSGLGHPELERWMRRFAGRGTDG